MKNGKYIVLDLDQTCVRCFDDAAEEPTNRPEFDSYDEDTKKKLKKRMKDFVIIDFDPFSSDPNNRKMNKFKIGENDKINITIIKRQYLDEFLEYCLENFEQIIIWSAGKFKYVHLIRDFILPDNPEILVLTFENLLDSNFVYIENKDLSKVFELVDGANDKNTIIIDDSLKSLSLKPRNGIWIPEFDGLYLLEEDNALKDLVNFFETPEFKNSTDVKTLPFNNIFSNIPSYLQHNYELYLLKRNTP